MLVEIDDELAPVIRQVAQKLSGYSRKEWNAIRKRWGGDDPVGHDLERIVEVCEVEADALAKTRKARLRECKRTERLKRKAPRRS